ncbi:hypothetical protein OIE82_19035 [Streptomyces althioticus]|jgi:hypothetical protein|uniref:Holin n=1 Tax=Streptomyces althioticus TaxID=83380 RepID=A0ABZ1Y6G0_9ACTN|nr:MULTISPECIES: hypothetical protein [Actinomycetes]ALV51161.1 hypothetical protein ASR50_18300 [Streptomyces sp. 4F]MCC9686734.1 hypothetical protein [Streptomyces sp. MNU103]WTB48219.1 hypothetical protein OG968_19095 [Streptomyces althioticus]GGT51521.1 hypothetical protein GCM10010243_32100 [Streptomyces matensis]MBM4830083.1 hypothetical protein [Actinospica acidiphila]
MTTTHPKASDNSATHTALWALVAVSGVANLVSSVAQAPLVVNLATGLVTLAALTTLGARHLRARRTRV